MSLDEDSSARLKGFERTSHVAVKNLRVIFRSHVHHGARFVLAACLSSPRVSR